tara:strand:+ start:454 stop:762 length:309 start_codon:yes stop_codon:yes gene_type:complete
MNPPSVISYMLEPAREIRQATSGWLVAPARDLCMVFIFDQKSAMAFPNVFTQLWFCTKEGVPTRLKNTRKLDYHSSFETWNELINNGWELIEHQFNACIDVA